MLLLARASLQGRRARRPFEPPTGKLDQETQAALADLIRLSHELAGIDARTGRKEPTVIT
ncbi:MAG TPA: hypothetical protein VNY10_09910 [Roseiarcus sp.]|nr:hypothetical protein [Roseiarcus sp.]